MPPPKWATTLLGAICEEQQVAVPILTWRRSSSDDSSGRYSPRRTQIIVTAGKDRQIQRRTLLHEIAHHLTPSHHHDAAFWEMAFHLYRKHKVPMRFALESEARYRAEAGKVALAMGIRGAKSAIAGAAVARSRRVPPRGICPMPADLADASGYRTPHTHYVGTSHYLAAPDGTHQVFHTAKR